MPRGPDKQFVPDEALEQAMLLFWEKGYAATRMAELQARMGLGAKSLYDTFGNKRQLFFRALDHYTNTVVRRLFDKLATHASPTTAVDQVMRAMAKLNAVEPRGCLLGVAMAQAQLSADEALTRHIALQLRVIEDAFCDAFERAKAIGELDAPLDSRDLARLYTAVFQGINLISRVESDAASSEGACRALGALSPAATR